MVKKDSQKNNNKILTINLVMRCVPCVSGIWCLIKILIKKPTSDRKQKKSSCSNFKRFYGRKAETWKMRFEMVVIAVLWYHAYSLKTRPSHHPNSFFHFSAAHHSVGNFNFFIVLLHFIMHFDCLQSYPSFVWMQQNGTFCRVLLLLLHTLVSISFPFCLCYVQLKVVSTS